MTNLHPLFADILHDVERINQIHDIIKEDQEPDALPYVLSSDELSTLAVNIAQRLHNEIEEDGMSVALDCEDFKINEGGYLATVTVSADFNDTYPHRVGGLIESWQGGDMRYVCIDADIEIHNPNRKNCPIYKAVLDVKLLEKMILKY